MFCGKVQLRHVAVLGVLALGGACGRSSAPDATQGTSADAGTTDADGRILESLRANGVDLSRSVAVDLFLSFPSESAANQAAGALRTNGYAVTVRGPDRDRKDWACLAQRSMVLSLAAMHDQRARLTALAKGFGGDYVMWDVPVAH